MLVFRRCFEGKTMKGWLEIQKQPSIGALMKRSSEMCSKFTGELTICNLTLIITICYIYTLCWVIVHYFVTENSPLNWDIKMSKAKSFEVVHPYKQLRAFWISAQQMFISPAELTPVLRGFFLNQERQRHLRYHQKHIQLQQVTDWWLCCI